MLDLSFSDYNFQTIFEIECRKRDMREYMPNQYSFILDKIQKAQKIARPLNCKLFKDLTSIEQMQQAYTHTQTHSLINSLTPSLSVTHKHIPIPTLTHTQGTDRSLCRNSWRRRRNVEQEQLLQLPAAARALCRCDSLSNPPIG